MAASLVGLGLWLAGGAVIAQDYNRTAPSPYSPTPTEPAKVLHYSRPAGVLLPAAEQKSDFSLQAADSSSYPSTPMPSPGGLSPAKLPLPIPVPITSRGPAAPPPRVASLTSDTSYNLNPVAYQQRSPQQRAAPDETLEYPIELEPPGPQKLFGRLDSEAALMERMRQAARERVPAERIEFPVEPVVGGRGPFVQRTFPQATMFAEPNYVCYSRLFFEEKNSERYGWDLGPVQPIVSTAAFYKDLIFLPYHMFTNPCRWYECSAGYCLPGDPVPYLCYPPQLSLTGSLAEIATGVALFAMFP
jgi:hypothetical protein